MATNHIETEILARLREKMARQQMTQGQLAEAVGVKPHTIGRALKGTVALKVRLLLLICDALELHAGGLLTQAMAATMDRREAEGAGGDDG